MVEAAQTQHPSSRPTVPAALEPFNLKESSRCRSAAGAADRHILDNHNLQDAQAGIRHTIQREPKNLSGIHWRALRARAQGLSLLLPVLEVRDDVLAEEAKGVEHLLVLRRPDGAQQDDLLDAERFIESEKADAVLRRADAEFGAFFTHLLRCGLARMRPAGEALVARVIALVVGRHGRGIIVAPHQARALALLLDVPADELGAAPGHDARILVTVARRHQCRAGRRPGPMAPG